MEPEKVINSEAEAAPLLDLQAWSRLRSDLMRVAKSWNRRGYGESDPAFFISDAWIKRALELEGVNPSCLDYLATYAVAGRINLHRGIHFLHLQDVILEKKKEALVVENALAASPAIALLAKRLQRQQDESPT